MAKIEMPDALVNFDGILAEVDSIMVARGDLGLESPIFEVPVQQKRMIKKCLVAKKFVITATEMLGSMQYNPRPTRAEVSDVANAVLDHTDAIMLSGETAMGKYPVRAIQMMTDIITVTEASEFYSV
jgi:pyruvate kinase